MVPQSHDGAENGETTGDNAKYIEYYNFSATNESGYNKVNGANWYYESRFDKIMPDLNLDSGAVRGEIRSIFEYWLKDMDCDGFRLDAVTSYYTGNVKKNVEFLKFVNDTAKSIKEDAYIVGEAWEGTDRQIREYYDSGCDSFFLFTMSAGSGSASSVKQLFSPLLSTPGQKLENLLLDLQATYDKGTLAPFLGNHDTARAADMLTSENLIKMGAGCHVNHERKRIRLLRRRNRYDLLGYRQRSLQAHSHALGGKRYGGRAGL